MLPTIAYYFNTVFTVVGCGLGRSHTFGHVTLLFSTQRSAYQGREGMKLPLLVFSCPLVCTLHFTFTSCHILVLSLQYIHSANFRFLIRDATEFYAQVCGTNVEHELTAKCLTLANHLCLVNAYIYSVYN